MQDKHPPSAQHCKHDGADFAFGRLCWFFDRSEQTNLINRAVMASIISDGLDLNGDKRVSMQALGPSYQKYIVLCDGLQWDRKVYRPP